VTAVLRISKLNKRFGGIVVADNIDLTIASGEVLGLIGPNGAGKTSLFNLISGVLRPDSGGIYLNDVSIVGQPLFRRARLGVARTWQHMLLFRSMSVLDNLMIAPRHYAGESILRVAFARGAVRAAESAARQRAESILLRMGLTDTLHLMVTDLPFGQQKLIGLARALMNDGPLLLLDEPMAGVEGAAYETMQRVVRQEAETGRAVCVVEHNVSFIRDLCSRAIFMANGKILQDGSVEELIASASLTELYFGV
jgi:ABC-type branched-subunit amino acid transport system ATPase component